MAELAPIAQDIFAGVLLLFPCLAAGVVGYVCAGDVPAGPSADVSTRTAWSVGPGEPLFAHDTVEYAGQALGLVLAHTLTAARAGAAQVLVEYGPVMKDSSSNTGRTAEAQAMDKEADSWQGTATSSSTGVPAAGDVSASQVSEPLLTLSAAVAADSWYDLSPLPNIKTSRGVCGPTKQKLFVA